MYTVASRAGGGRRALDARCSFDLSPLVKSELSSVGCVPAPIQPFILLLEKNLPILHA